MDFMALLQVANKNNQMNEKLAKTSKSGFSTNLGPAKRQVVQKPKGVQSQSVRAFLEKKEQEEKAKEIEAKKKKDALLELRKDAKTTKKANAMAKRTKDNLKVYGEKDELQILEDRAKLEEKRLAFIAKLKESEQKGGKTKSKTVTSTSVSSGEVISDKQRRADKKLMEKYDLEVGDGDEDDVKLEVINPDKQILDRDGYRAREEARRRELQEKYKGKEKPTDLKALKRDKSKHGHDKHKDKHSSSSKHKHKHKHKHKDSKHSKDKKTLGNKEIRKGPPKPKFKRPNTQGKPVLSFADLLKIANQKHEEVLKPEAAKKPEAEAEKKPFKKQPDRPMTQEEKDRYNRRQSKEYKTWLEKGGVLSIGKKDSDDGDDDPKPTPRSDTPRSDKPKNGPSHHQHHHSKSTSSQGRPSLDSSHNREESTPKERPRSQTSRPGLSAVPSRQPVGGRPTPSSATSSQAKRPPPKPDSASRSSTVAGVKREAGGVSKAAAPQEAYSNPFDRIMGQIKKSNPKPEKKRRVIESDEEEEYDEELDDFIVDEEDEEDANFIDDSEAQDYSSVIRNIFGYDRRKYRDEDEADLRTMDVGFSQTLKEEARSAKIGRMEDLEDMRKEEEEKKRKMMLKKKMKMKGR